MNGIMRRSDRGTEAKGALFFAFLLAAVLLVSGMWPAAVWAAVDQTNVIVPVTYTAKNVDETLRCYLEADEDASQIIRNDTLELKDGETGNFTVTYTSPGTYHCRIRQIKGTDDEVVYDEHVFYVDSYITSDEEGNLQANAVIYEEGTDKLPSAYFINQNIHDLTPTPAISVTPTAEPGVSPSVTPWDAELTPGAEDRTDGTNPVQTGDGTPAAVPYVMTLLAAGVAAVLVIRKRRV